MSFKLAGIQFTIAGWLTWFTVAMGTEQPNPLLWTDKSKLFAAVLVVVFSSILFSNELREERE